MTIPHLQILLGVGVLALCLTMNTVTAADGFDVRCTETKNETVITGNVTTTKETLDSCDSSLHLVCLSGRCGCQDPVKYIYIKQEFKRSELPSFLLPQVRTKRSPGKKVKGKKVGTGTAVAGGVIAGVAGYQVGKAVAGSSSSSSGGSSKGDNRKVAITSCFARVQTDCAIDPNAKHTMSKTTTQVDAAGNTTTVIREETVDYTKYPLCVSKAVCRRKSVTVAGADSNVGECICKEGYKRDSKDLCEKSNGVVKLPSFTANLFGFVLTIFLSQVYTKSIV